MSKSILEKISDELLVRLSAITVANGYEFDASSVVRVNRDTNAYEARPLRIIVDQKDEQYNDELSFPGNPPASASDVTFQIWGYGHKLDVKNEIGVDSPDVTDNQMMATIRAAITNDRSVDWYTFGGNAFNAHILAGEPFDGPGHDGGTVLLTIQYRTSEIDPYTKR